MLSSVIDHPSGIAAEGTMKIERILFPTDFSECSDAALEFASRLASESNALLIAVHVVEMPKRNGDAGAADRHYAVPWNAERQDVMDKLRQVKPTIATVNVEHRCLSGSPVSEILKAAEHEDADVIVIGSHGRTGLTKLLMGSVAEGLMRKATCPVLVVKQPVPVVGDVSAVVLAGPPG
jgi:nucleotide-binding universal stress UspA family protein